MKKIFLILSLLISTYANSQDIHFTQFASSPLNTNPANTGLINGSWRFASNYRNQWSALGSPFVTTSFSADMALLRSKLKSSWFGIGLLGFYDVSGTAKLENTTYGLSLAYHRRLNNNTQLPHLISLGGQALMVQKSINLSSLNGTQPDNFNVMDPYPDFNAGIMYSGYLSTRTTIYAGLSHFHILRPIESFLGNDYRIHTRTSVNLGGSSKINKKLDVYYSGLYQQQGQAYEVLIGGAVGVTLNPEEEIEHKRSQVVLGTWYRYSDAIVPYIGFSFAGFQLGFNYDINVSSLSVATQGKGAFELSLIYNRGGKNSNPNNPMMAYPRF